MEVSCNQVPSHLPCQPVLSSRPKAQLPVTSKRPSLCSSFREASLNPPPAGFPETHTDDTLGAASSTLFFVPDSEPAGGQSRGFAQTPHREASWATSVTSVTHATVHVTCQISSDGGNRAHDKAGTSASHALAPASKGLSSAVERGKVGEHYRGVRQPENVRTDLLQDFTNLLRAFDMPLPQFAGPANPAGFSPDGYPPPGSPPQKRQCEGGFGAACSKKARGAEQQEVVRLTLEEMYFGTLKSVPVQRQILDEVSGRSIAVKETIWIDVQPGVQEGSRIRCPGRGSEVPHGSRGRAQDLVFVVEQARHPRFERLGDYLITDVAVDLKTALCGGSVHVKTLDDRDLQVPLNGVVTPNSQLVVPGEGMPLPRSADRKGDLLLNIVVRFPTQLSPVEKAGIASLLPR